MEIYSDIKNLKGVGEKYTQLLNKCGIFSVLDLLLYIPKDYQSFKYNNNIQSLIENVETIIECKLISVNKDIITRNRKIISSAIFTDGKKNLTCKWFNSPYIKNQFKINKLYRIKGKTSLYRNNVIFINPKLEDVNNKENKSLLIPKYSLCKNLTNNFITKLIQQVFENMRIKENLPNYIIEKYNLCSLDKALRYIHNPKSCEEINLGKNRLKFQELFIYSLKILILQSKNRKKNLGIKFNMSSDLKTLKESLPFTLTNAQSKAIREILIDEKRDIAMNRLLQGDVGSGKTIVAIIAMFNIVRNGYQATIIAPTEILARQHYIETKNILDKFNIKIELLTGSVVKKYEILDRLKKGDINILVGTHAILEENVEFFKLGMAVIDEQHRFGVMQRSKLYNKGENIDILVMSATPIPRTLALSLYGDLNLSIINELPPGRKKIKTCFIDANQSDRAYKFSLKEIKKGRQIYIVCPLIEENEKLTDLDSISTLYKKLKETYYKDINVGILHGKMKSKDKDIIMNDFKNNKIKVLISTTVIEVGVNIPNATVMIIENAERFGLSQLHQLRGRVGRGNFDSYCILIAQTKNPITRKRMAIMQKSNDGFFIAEEDLKLRGTGEIFGFKQHGDSSFIISDLINDFDIFKIANNEAKRVLASNNKEDVKLKEKIEESLNIDSKYICFN